MTFDFILTSVLRLFGLLWMIGGFLVIKNARLSILADKALDEIGNSLESELDEFDASADDPARERWLLVGGILTFICGAALVAASHLAAILLTVMVFHQALYVLRQNHKVMTATSDLEAEEAQINQTTRNGAVTAVIIWIAALVLYRDQLFNWSTTFLTWIQT